MKLFLSSNIGGSYLAEGKWTACALNEENNLLNLLGEFWRANSKCLIISSAPDEEEINNSFRSVYEEAFKISKFSLSKMDICDRRNEDKLRDTIYDYDVLILAGGHVPTQNDFFKHIQLKELMKNYNGIVIGISAGTMNCAEVVYAQPELDGEAIDPNYQRYLDGLNLTQISVLPHFQELKELLLDGLRVVEDISLPDSKIRPFYALVDGAFILVEDNKSVLYGEGYLINDGDITMICETDMYKQLL